MSTTVVARRDRVWRALTDPSELALWNPGRIDAVDPPADYPRPGQRTRWHCRLGRVPVTLLEELLEVVPGERLRARMALGPFGFLLTYTFSTNGDPGRTQLGLRIVVENVVAVAGGVLDRFEVRRVTTQLATDTLEALQSWCEEGLPDPAPRPGPAPVLPFQPPLLHV